MGQMGREGKGGKEGRTGRGRKGGEEEHSGSSKFATTPLITGNCSVDLTSQSLGWCKSLFSQQIAWLVDLLEKRMKLQQSENTITTNNSDRPDYTVCYVKMYGVHCIWLVYPTE